MSVNWSVCRSVGLSVSVNFYRHLQAVLYFNFYISVTAPAHPHATSAAVYTALFLTSSQFSSLSTTKKKGQEETERVIERRRSYGVSFTRRGAGPRPTVFEHPSGILSPFLSKSGDQIPLQIRIIEFGGR